MGYRSIGVELGSRSRFGGGGGRGEESGLAKRATDDATARMDARRARKERRNER